MNGWMWAENEENLRKFYDIKNERRIENVYECSLLKLIFISFKIMLFETQNIEDSKNLTQVNASASWLKI